MLRKFYNATIGYCLLFWEAYKAYRRILKHPNKRCIYGASGMDYICFDEPLSKNTNDSTEKPVEK